MTRPMSATFGVKPWRPGSYDSKTRKPLRKSSGLGFEALRFIGFVVVVVVVVVVVAAVVVVLVVVVVVVVVVVSSSSSSSSSSS